MSGGPPQRPRRPGSARSRSALGALLFVVSRPFAPLFEHERLLMISISTVLVMAGQGVIAPVLPLYAKEFGVGSATIGLTLSFFALARLLLNVPLGALSDRRGRRFLLVSGPVVVAIGMVGSGLAGGIEELLAWRFIAGAGSGMYMTGAIIYLADISTPQNRARLIGGNQAALLVGTSIGPALGGVLGDAFGLRVPFYVVGGGAMIAAVYAYLRLPETRRVVDTDADPADGAHPRAPKQRTWLRIIRSRDFAAISFVTFAMFLTRTASRQTLVPLLAVSRFNMSVGTLGAIFAMMSIINVILIAPAAIAADRFGRKAVLVPAGLVMMAALLVYGQAGSVLIFIIASVILAVGSAITGPAPAAYVADIAPPNARGLAMGLHRSTGDIGFVIGPPLLGWLADNTSFAWGLAANAILVGVAALTFGLVARETIHRQPAHALPPSTTPEATTPDTETPDPGPKSQDGS